MEGPTASTMKLRRFHKSKVANAIGAVGALGGAAALTYKLVQQVRSGRGLDHYIAMSGQEWSPLAALVLMSLALAVLIVGGLLRCVSQTCEDRSFVATLRRRIIVQRDRPARGSDDTEREEDAVEQ